MALLDKVDYEGGLLSVSVEAYGASDNKSASQERELGTFLANRVGWNFYPALPNFIDNRKAAYFWQ